MGRIALTFDDGPNPAATPLILDLLDKYQVKASFFMLGKRASEYPELAQAVALRGHLIGTHGYNHLNYAELSEDEVLDDIAHSLEILEQVTGMSKISFIRPPYGRLTPAAKAAAKNYDLIAVPWSLDSKDYDWPWEGVSAENLPTRTIEFKTTDIAIGVISGSENGSIVMMHDGNHSDKTGWQVRALPGYQALDQIIPALMGKDFEFVTIAGLGPAVFARQAAEFFQGS